MSRYVKGPIQARSPLFSRVWEFATPDERLATVTRNIRRRTSTIELADGTTWTIEPDGWGRLALVENGQTIATAQREGATGRTWTVSGQAFSYELGVDSMLLRRWHLGPSGSTIATLHGGALSFNTMRIETGLAIPLEAIVLSWHPIVRAWEAAATLGSG